jgi:hypothetical protein
MGLIRSSYQMEMPRVKQILPREAIVFLGALQIFRISP